jgi:hypothetical protein
MATKKKKKGSASASRQPAKKKSAPKAAAKKKAAPTAKAPTKKPIKAVKRSAIKRSVVKTSPMVERAKSSSSDESTGDLEHSQAALDLRAAAKQASLARLLRR